MNTLKATVLCLLLCSCAISCKKDLFTPKKLEITGTIHKQGITTYQYGSHVMSGYALRSDCVDLDDYIDQNVTVVGHKINGYPVEGGPEYVEVKRIK